MNAEGTLIVRLWEIVGESPTIAASIGLTAALRQYAADRAVGTTETWSEPATPAADDFVALSERYGYADSVVDRDERILPRGHVLNLVATAYENGARRTFRPRSGS